MFTKDFPHSVNLIVRTGNISFETAHLVSLCVITYGGGGQRG